MKLRILSAQDVQTALPMPQAIQVMRRAFGQYSANQAVMPLRTRLETDKGLMLLMPAYLQQSRELGLKTVSIWGDNPAKGLPLITALVTVFDCDTGQPIALINGETLTAIRTGAGGGLAAELLARPESQVVALFGAGVQAKAQLEAVCTVRSITEVRLMSRTSTSVKQLADEVNQWPNPPKIVLPNTAQAAVKGADIVITATNATTPVFAGEDISPGTHITAVGSYTPTMQEVDETTIQRAKIVVDSRSACLAETGDLLIPLQNNIITADDIHTEIGQLVNGEQPGRISAEEITYFKSVGIAVQDATAASELLKIAEKQGLGQVVVL